MEIIGLPLFEFIMLSLFGLVISFVGGYAGIGGAPFLIFFLTAILSNYTQHEAQGTVLAVMLGPMSLFGVIALREAIRPYFKYVVLGTISYAIFSYVGGSIAYLFSSNSLKILFGILIIAISFFRLFKLIKNRRQTNEQLESKKALIPLNLFTFSITGSVVGIIGGMFGVGAGVLMVPIFTGIYRIKKDSARGISLAILLPPVSLGAVIKYSEMGDIRWNAVLVMFVTFFIVNYFGAKLAKGHSHKTFTLFFSLILGLLGVVTIILGLNIFSTTG